MARKAPNGFGSIRKVQKSGKIYYEGRYTDPLLHKQRSVSATTQAECKRKLQEIQAGIVRGDFCSPVKVTLGAWLNQWIQSRENITDDTRRLYQQTADLYIAPHIGHIRLQDLRYIHCQDFVSNITHDTQRTKPLSSKTIKNIIGVLSAALAAAVKAQLIASNPAAGLDLPRVTKAPPKVMNSTEQDLFVEAIRKSPYQNIFLTGLHTGMRISEILGLTWRDIDLKTGTISINKQLKRQRGEGTARILADTKTASSNRTILVPPFVIDILRRESIQQKEHRLKAGTLWRNAENLVFTREDGSPMPHTTVSNAFKRIAAQIGRPDLTFHSLRHTAITDALAAGIDVKTVSANAGHASATMTLDVYADSTVEMKRQAADKQQARHEAKNA